MRLCIKGNRSYRIQIKNYPTKTVSVSILNRKGMVLQCKTSYMISFNSISNIKGYETYLESIFGQHLSDIKQILYTNL